MTPGPAPFPPPDLVLLDYDPAECADDRPDESERLLTEYPEAFRAQLVAAKWSAGWADRCESENSPLAAMAPHWAESGFGKGYVTAIREIVCYLRQGYLMPGGLHYDEMFSEE
jgi:hypothetical protein